MSLVSSITVQDENNLSIITVGTQGAAGPNQILAKSVGSITLGASDEGGLLIYDNGNNQWTVTTQGSSPSAKIRQLTFSSGGASVTEIKDEDNFASNSATSLATQQSIKAYVDSQVSGSGSLAISDGSGSIAITLASETLGLKGGTGVTATYSNNDVTFAIGQSVGTTDNVTFNNVIVSGNLTVSGTQTTVNTATLSVADNKITVNSDYSGSSPSENGGIEVERGTQDNVEFVWNETNDRWTADNPLQATAYYVGTTQIVDSSGVWQGPSAGLKGQKGEVGSQGSQGSKGEKGSTGSTGSQGDKGNKGEVGVTGPTGNQGIQGVKGQKGEVGATGSQGVQGDQGIQGDKGQKGEVGSKGQKGEVGNTGSQGIQGDKGQKGEVGSQGNKGQKGEQGIQGNQGDKGQKGQTGDTGSQGDKGQKGQIGDTGATGSKGQKGEIGSKGQKGEVGSKGQKGQTGNTGSTGSQGDKGQKGTKGQVGGFGGQTFNYVFNTATSDADPTAGKLAFNNADISAATTMFIDDSDDDGSDIQTFLRTIDDSDSTIKGHVRISNRTDASDFAILTIGGSITEASGYFKVPVSYVSGSATAFSNSENIVSTFARTGDVGDTGAKGQKGQGGTDGSDGSKGQKGEVGITGPQGSTGPTGDQGSKGQKGEVGVTGSAGQKGQKGEVGVTGDKGQKGQGGTNGTDGNDGDKGQK